MIENQDIIDISIYRSKIYVCEIFVINKSPFLGKGNMQPFIHFSIVLFIDYVTL